MDQDPTSQKLLEISNPEVKINGVEGENRNSKQRSRTHLSFLVNEYCFSRNLTIFRLISLCLLIVSAWGSLYFILERVDLPTTDLLKSLSLIWTSYLVGELFHRVYLPNVVGMFLSGVLFRNVSYFTSVEELRPWFITARYAAIAVVLIKSGLGVNFGVCKKYPGTLLKLTFLPAVGEAAAVALAAKYLLPQNYPWLWAILFGFAIAAFSPTVATEILGKLKDKGLYSNEKMSALYSTCAPFDAIINISLFAVTLWTISETRLEASVLKGITIGFLHLVLGFIVGSFWGCLSACFPHKDDEHCVIKRTGMLLLGAMCMYFGAKVCAPPGGPLGCFMSGAMAAAGFKFQGWKPMSSVSTVISNLWSWFMEPMLFALVGVEIDLSSIAVYDVALNIVVICLGSMIRCLVSIACLMGTGFCWNEKTFFILSTLPKATVEAAIGPQAFDIFWNTPDNEKSMNILQTSVLSVIVMTTVAKITLNLCSQKLLVKKENPKTVESI